MKTKIVNVCTALMMTALSVFGAKGSGTGNESCYKCIRENSKLAVGRETCGLFGRFDDRYTTSRYYLRILGISK